jgi:putative transposase
MTIENQRMQKISLKKLDLINEDSIIGFFDETSPQTTANTVKLWSFHKPEVIKNTTRLKANTFGFYALNGKSKKEDVVDFLYEIRKHNPDKEIILILDNFRSHKASTVALVAAEIKITLIFLPPYSPDLNPIEFIWKSIKRQISTNFIRDIGQIRSLIRDAFSRLSMKLSFAKQWIEEFLSEDIKYKIIGS